VKPIHSCARNFAVTWLTPPLAPQKPHPSDAISEEKPRKNMVLTNCETCWDIFLDRQNETTLYYVEDIYEYAYHLNIKSLEVLV